MRNNIILHINGERFDVHGREAFMPLAEYLRYKTGHTGTKVVCAEGDCGACSILVATPKNDFVSVNSCIGFVYQYDGKSIVTVEGLKEHKELHPVQDAMAENHGAQCGYCTPGIVCSLAGLCDSAKKEKCQSLTEKKIKNSLTGNLCRCTGYEPIIKAGLAIDLDKVELLIKRYPFKESSEFNESIAIEIDQLKVFMPTSLDELLKLKQSHGQAKLISGGTDLGVLSNKGRWKMESVISMAKMPLGEIKIDNDNISIGATATLDEVEQELKADYPEFSNILKIFAAPQIKNTGTLVGNIANGSPIGDTIPFLKVIEAKLVLKSLRGVREVNINDFYLGYKQLDLKEDELITEVIIPKTKDYVRLYKASLRKDLDISAVTFAGRISVENKKIKTFSLALGGVGATVLRMTDIEKQLIGKSMERSTFEAAAKDVMGQLTPFSDVRGSKEFRKQLCHNFLLKFYDEVAHEHR